MLHVAMPGIVRSFDPETQTADILPCCNEKGVPMPLLSDVPVFFPGSASSAITWPVQPGDECLLIFSDIGTDGWYLTGSASDTDFMRKHSLSDAFAFVGFRSRRNALTSFPDHPSFFGDTDCRQKNTSC